MPSKPQPRDAETEKIHLNYCYGGASVDYKLAIANSFFSSQALDFRTFPSQTSVLPGATAIGLNTTDLIQVMDQDLNGVRYGVGDTGNLYRIDTSNNFSEIAKLSENGSAGLLYYQVTDQLYIPGQTKASLYGQVTSGISGSPSFRQDNFAQSASTAPGVTNLFNTGDGFFDGIVRNSASGYSASGVTKTSQITTTTATGTWPVPIAISEVPGKFCFFAPDIEPFYSIAVNVTAIGTGDWTLTLHDSLNNPLIAITITHANMVVGYNEFVFGKQIRALVNASQTGSSPTYHWHITSTVGDGTIAVVPLNGGTGATGDCTSADFLLFAYRLVQTNNGWHPTAYFTGQGKALLCIGNGPYLSTYDFSNDANPTNGQWVRHGLTFKLGYEVCGTTTNNQYLVIGVERRSKSASHNFQDGALYFWSGSNQSQADFVIDIPMGAPYGLQTFNNVTYFVVAGSLYAWSGGQTVLKVRKLAYQNTDYTNVTDTTLVAPNMMAIRYNLLMIGYPSSTTNIAIDYGVYTWGSVELMYPNSLGFSYALSNGVLNNNTDGNTNLQIGCVYNFVDTMYTPWKYTDSNSVTHFGVDLINNSSTPAPNFNLRSLIYDGGVSYKTKNSLRMQVTFLPLPTGYTLQAFYSLNRGADVLSDNAAVGDEKLVFEIDNARFHELQWGFYGTSSGATIPAVITGLTMEIQPLEDESDLRAPETT